MKLNSQTQDPSSKSIRIGLAAIAIPLSLLLLAGASCMIVSETARHSTTGKQLYVTHCAVCHGENGTGNGPASELFRVPPPDLTRIEERRGVAFPYMEIRNIIDGRREILAHGKRDMPIWGRRFTRDAEEQGLPNPELLGEGSLIALTSYLEEIQQVNVETEEP